MKRSCSSNEDSGNIKKWKNEATYKRGAGGIDGMDFQLNVKLHMLLKSKNSKLINFKISSEHKDGGKFDDIVITYDDKDEKRKFSYLLQIKHVLNETNKVSFKELVEKNDKFSLTKYFDSFKKIIEESEFKVSLKHLILFTNLNTDGNYFEKAKTSLPFLDCEPLNGSTKQSKFYRLNPDFINAYSENKKLSNTEKELFKKFCDYLILACNQLNDQELEAKLTSQCSVDFHESLAKIVKKELQSNVRTEFKANNRCSFDCKFLDDRIEYIKDNIQELVILYNSRNEIAEMLNQKIVFEILSLKSDIEMFINAKEKKLLQIIIHDTGHLTSIKIIFCLHNHERKFLFTSKRTIKEDREVFRKSTCYNVFVWRQSANLTSDFELILSDLIGDIKDEDKKVIVIIRESQSVSAAQLKVAENWIQRCYDETKFEHLTTDTRNELMGRNVSFQGYNQEIKQIIGNGFQLTQIAHDSWGDLLSRSEIEIGKNVNLSTEYNSDYYIQRTIVLTNPNDGREQFFNEKEFIQHALLEDQGQPLQEEMIDNTSNFVSCKIFILSDSPGMGKTTVSSSIAAEIKRSHCHFWVIRLAAMECTYDLNHFDESNTTDDTYDDFLLLKLLKLSSPLERFIFGQYWKNEKSVNKFVIIFDGYDEINLKCQRVITKLLQHLSRKVNAGFFLITTTPQFQQDLEENFQHRTCSLKPFEIQNKIDFLRGYWSYRGTTGNSTRITEYAEQLIKCISGSITEAESKLMGIPLQMSMLAEINEEKARYYVEHEEDDLSSSTMSIGLFNLYDEYVTVKKTNFQNQMKNECEKGFYETGIGNALQYQNEFAREIILKRSDVSKVEVKKLDVTTIFGIIQKNKEDDFYFIHRTFAEFLTAKYLIEEIIENDSVPNAEKIKNGLLIEQIKDNSLLGVRKFLNSRLNATKFADECKRSKDKMAIQELFGDEFEAIILTAAEEEIHEFLKLTIDVNSFLEPERILFKLIESLQEVEDNSKSLTAILDCMLHMWLPSKDVILIKIIDFLIREILVNNNSDGSNIIELTKSTIAFQNKLKEAKLLTEKDLRIMLFNVKNDAERGRYWNVNIIEYLKHLRSTPRDDINVNYH